MSDEKQLSEYLQKTGKQIYFSKMIAANGIRVNRELSGGEHGLTLWYHHNGNRLVYRQHNSHEKLELH